MMREGRNTSFNISKDHSQDSNFQGGPFRSLTLWVFPGTLLFFVQVTVLIRLNRPSWLKLQPSQNVWIVFILMFPDMEFVQNFTPPDFQVKNFTPPISPNFNSFSKKKHKKWVKMEKFTPLARNFTLPPALTAPTNFNSDCLIKNSSARGHCFLAFRNNVIS